MSTNHSGDVLAVEKMRREIAAFAKRRSPPAPPAPEPAATPEASATAGPTALSEPPDGLPSLAAFPNPFN